VQASQHGVPQLRPRFVLAAIKLPWAARFSWPETPPTPQPTVGEVLGELMGARRWPGATARAERIHRPSPAAAQSMAALISSPPGPARPGKPSASMAAHRRPRTRARSSSGPAAPAHGHDGGRAKRLRRLLGILRGQHCASLRPSPAPAGAWSREV
jgi:DNA (cytosine-5)-methyltransferase 1